MTIVVSQAIFEEGKAAKAAGKAYTDDPYRAGSQESADWLSGFTVDEIIGRSTAVPENEGDGFTKKGKRRSDVDPTGWPA